MVIFDESSALYLAVQFRLRVLVEIAYDKTRKFACLALLHKRDAFKQAVDSVFIFIEKWAA